ncbi:GspE/PulE family protein [Patescibacteria group bacterium]|nr:GspE/PulE family protein [Patescibacteria group bacterium]MBU1016387.1 GspE/PulE family protein [Patescibacteria group bacterium]MBU1685463.1 GspE/PulE family protein [Patescibacteria group bacterium]MBU1938734.1 GspE/PulE family protein [Patescibacteria group bacterium]
MPDSTSDFTSKAQQQIAGMKQEAKEQDIREKAKRMGYPYVNLLHFSVNPDLRAFISQEKSVKAKAAAFFKSGKKVRLAVLNPDLPATKALVTELKIKGYDVTVIICSPESLQNAQMVYFAEEKEKHGKLAETVLTGKTFTAAEEIEHLEGLKEKIEHSPFDEALTQIQVGAYSARASDIHFQPQDKDVLVRFRIDGVLRPVFNLSREVYGGLIKQIKYLSHLKLNITNVPQDGQYGFVVNQRKINVRISLMPSHYGETIVMRLLDTARAFEAFEKLGYEGQALSNVEEALKLPHGMILVTGPTGSGKTTTMYSMLQSVDTKSKKVITLEDPIEYDLNGITQSQVNHNVDYNFATGLRAILRQDPDVIMIGEIRDLETAETAAQASLTGHLVISTLHTNSALESISRLVNMGVKSFILAPAIDLIIAQRLVRRLCECAEEKPMSESEKEQIELLTASILKKGIEAPVVSQALKHPKGCKKCGQTGYAGQIAIAEVLRFDQVLRDLILEGKPMSEIHNYIFEHLKMLTLQEDGVLKVLRGVTTLEEIYRVAA